MNTVIRHFTFGQSHMCNHPDLEGLLADHWVTVALPRSHREVFIDQFAFEYPDRMLDPQHFPRGQLALIQELV